MSAAAAGAVDIAKLYWGLNLKHVAHLSGSNVRNSNIRNASPDASKIGASRIGASRIVGSKFALVALGIGAALAGASALLATAQPAAALPLFARQTGQPCGNCHTDVLGLTPFGRRFKLGGYTLGGGPFRKTLFPIPPSGKVLASVGDLDSVLVPGHAPKDAVAELRSYADAVGSGDPGKSGPKGNAQQAIDKSFAAVQPQPDEERGWFPPVAAMVIAGYTRTQAPDPNWTSGVNHWNANDNVGLAQASLFAGGAMSDHVGVFAQLTYGFPAIADATGRWNWDNVDVRYAATGQIGDVDVLYGITAHNNPTV